MCVPGFVGLGCGVWDLRCARWDISFRRLCSAAAGLGLRCPMTREDHSPNQGSNLCPSRCKADFSSKIYLFAFILVHAASLLLRTGFPCRRERGLLLWSTASRPVGFSNRGLWAPQCRLRGHGALEVVLRHVGSSWTQD